MKVRWGQVLFWSVLSAAFIGPGTVTTCAKAGATYGTTLIWALVFSTFACVVLQEAATRAALATGLDLGAALRQRFSGIARVLVVGWVLAAIVAGCAAYQAGNLLGAVAGAQLALPGSRLLWVGILAALAALLLATARTETLARLLGALVGLMGLAFVVTAIAMAPAVGELLRGAFVPSIPRGSGTLVLGMIGTTVVPYNLFLASGLARGRRPDETRVALTIAIVLGGGISIAVLVVGSGLEAAFSFEALAETLGRRLGAWAGIGFAFGLLAAGLSSALTAPLAAALAARGLFEGDSPHRWDQRGWRFRAVWAVVLVVGIGFSVTGIRPVPAILAAQALNGAILPTIAVFLFVVVNDRERMGSLVNGLAANSALYACVAVTLMLGVSGVSRALAAALGWGELPARSILWLGLAALLLVSALMYRLTRRRVTP